MKSHGFVGVLHNPEDGVMKLTITLVIDKSLAPSLERKAQSLLHLI